MNNDFARALHFLFLLSPFFSLFLWKHPSLSTKWVRQKCSIKTSGLNSSFIILGLICNCRFVFCHFEAQKWELRNYSRSSSSSRQRWGSATLIYQILMKMLEWEFWFETTYLYTSKTPHLQIFTCSLPSVKRVCYFVYTLCSNSHQSKVRPAICCPWCHFMQKTLDCVFVLMPEATERAGPAHWSPFHWWREGVSGEEEVKVTLSGKWWESSGRDTGWEDES